MVGVANDEAVFEFLPFDTGRRVGKEVGGWETKGAGSRAVRHPDVKDGLRGVVVADFIGTIDDEIIAVMLIGYSLFVS